MAWKVGIPQWPGRMGLWIIGLLLLNLAFILRPEFLEPSPYSDVDLVAVTSDGQTLRIDANFYKTGCTFVRLTVVGFVAGATDILQWRDGHGLPPDFDRDPGSQSLSLAVALKGQRYDWVEIRTRHDCDGRSVDRVFARIRLPQDLSADSEA
jgi:hypothetical protein